MGASTVMTCASAACDNRGRPMRGLRFALVSIILLGMGVGGTAWAHTIAVVRPDRSDQTLVEAFSRLCGELRMYGFQVRLLDGLDEAAPLEARGQSGKASDVVGGVALVRAPGQASAKIWVAADASGKESVRITVSVADADAPSLLAIRTADVLRASLRNLRGAEPATAQPERKPDARPARESDAKPQEEVTASPAGPAPAGEAHDDRWSVEAGPSTLFEVGKMGLGWGAHVQARGRISERIRLALAFTGPVMGQAYDAAGATAHLRQELATLGLALRLLRARSLDIDVFQGVGVMHLSLHGEARSPWVAQDASAWAAASATGLAARVALSEHWGLEASAAALFLIPRPVVDVADVSYVTHQPFLQASTGLSFGY